VLNNLLSLSLPYLHSSLRKKKGKYAPWYIDVSTSALWCWNDTNNNCNSYRWMRSPLVFSSIASVGCLLFGLCDCVLCFSGALFFFFFSPSYIFFFLSLDLVRFLSDSLSSYFHSSPLFYNIPSVFFVCCFLCASRKRKKNLCSLCSFCLFASVPFFVCSFVLRTALLLTGCLHLCVV
jgi:hypothetical protein